MFLFFLSAALFGASFLLYWLSKRQSLKAMTAGTTPELPLSQVVEDCTAVSRELGSGSFRQALKVHGRLVCSHPLISEISQTPCVAYRFSVTREYEELSWSTDEKGNRHQVRQRKSEVVAHNERFAPFEIDDGTRSVRVSAQGAKFDLVPTHSSFEQIPRLIGGMLSLEVITPAGGTLGYRYEESCLPLDAEVSIFAEASDLGGPLELRKPESKDALFVVSPRSIQELTQGVRTAGLVLFGSSVGVAVLAAITLMLGVIR